VRRQLDPALRAPRSGRRSGRDSEPPPLTPYQARLDVAMDDTAVSRVRDPSVSIRIGSEPFALRSVENRRSRRLDAAASVALGAILGALLVVSVVALVRALLH
jgi:hypothetical protein